MSVRPSTGSVRTVGELLNKHSKALLITLDLDASSARIEAQCLLQAVLQVNRAYLLSHPEQSLNEKQLSRYRVFLERRLAGEPIAYILGKREFYGLNFKVTPATLIPRSETELLVELALQRIPQGGVFRMLDLGTGSGALALSIAYARPDVAVVAVDASSAALEVAQFNTQNLGLKNVRCLHSDWFTALHGERFDLIVANPPYVADDDTHLMQGDLRFEPRSALAAGADGLDDIRRIIAQAQAHLNPDAWLLLEHGHDQAVRVRDLLQQAGYISVFSARDLADIERVSGGFIRQ